MRTFEEYDLHQKNSPAITGVNSTKIRRGGASPQFGQNVDDNEFVDTDGSGEGTTDGTIPSAGEDYAHTEPSVNTHLTTNISSVGAMASTPGNKIPTEEEKDSIMIPAFPYTKKGITGDQYTKVGYTSEKIKKFDDM